jgi:hypothetical protein
MDRYVRRSSLRRPRGQARARPGPLGGRRPTRAHGLPASNAGGTRILADHPLPIRSRMDSRSRPLIAARDEWRWADQNLSKRRVVRIDRASLRDVVGPWLTSRDARAA